MIEEGRNAFLGRRTLTTGSLLLPHEKIESELNGNGLRMPRKSAAAREMEGLLASRSKLKLVASQPDPPPPPSDLQPPERRIWEAVHREYVGGETAQHILHSALQMHARAREARAVVAKEGMMVETRLGTRVPHPVLQVERLAEMHPIGRQIGRSFWLSGRLENTPPLRVL
jgi:hypothetical protein